MNRLRDFKYNSTKTEKNIQQDSNDKRSNNDGDNELGVENARIFCGGSLSASLSLPHSVSTYPFI